MTKKCGYASLIGAPNAGKSTLLNSLIDNKISIVTAKPQTTRNLVRGILTQGDAQIIFVDTPGIFQAKPKYEQAMVEAAWTGADDADAILLIVDAHRGIDDDTKMILESLKKRNKQPILVLNKVDKMEKHELLELSQALYQITDFERSFMISAKLGSGVQDIARYLAEKMPQAEWLYPEDEMTDLSERMIAAEITREQCFLRLHAELPYSLMVETEKWEEKTVKNERVIRINQIIVIEKESQKKIILGKSGAMLKTIGSTARHKIEEALGCKVHLFLFVKVQESWKSNPEIIQNLK